VVEQYMNRKESMDMVLRLKIDDKDTLLVGLRNEGQKITVDVKTTNESLMNMLQSNKEAISKNLESKHIYANIFVDPNGEGGFDRREGRRENANSRRGKQTENEFVEFFEASL